MAFETLYARYSRLIKQARAAMIYARSRHDWDGYAHWQAEMRRLREEKQMYWESMD